MSRRGFTLIELLVVISIIALLSSVVLASLNAAREKGRLAAGKQFEAGVYRAVADMAVGVWDFDECSGGAGAVVADRSENGNNGTLYSTPPSWSIDTPLGFGCSLLFSAGTDRVDVADSQSLAFSGDATLSVWIKPTVSGGGAYRTIFSKRGTGTNYELSLNNSDGSFLYYNGSIYTSSFVPPLGQWSHVAAVISGSTLSLYANGALVRQVAAAPVSAHTGNSLIIGAAPGVGQQFVGSIDSVRIFAKSLTAVEVGKLYAQDATRFFSAQQ